MNTSSRQCSFLQQLKRATGQESHQGVNICYPNRCEANTLIHSEGSGSLYVSVFPILPSATSISALSSWKAGGASVYHITGLQDEYRLSNTCQRAKQVNVQPYHNLWLKKYMLLVDRGGFTTQSLLSLDKDYVGQTVKQPMHFSWAVSPQLGVTKQSPPPPSSSKCAFCWSFVCRCSSHVEEELRPLAMLECTGGESAQLHIWAPGSVIIYLHFFAHGV